MWFRKPQNVSNRPVFTSTNVLGALFIAASSSLEASFKRTELLNIFQSLEVGMKTFNTYVRPGLIITDITQNGTC